MPSVNVGLYVSQQSLAALQDATGLQLARGDNRDSHAHLLTHNTHHDSGGEEEVVEEEEDENLPD